MPIYTYNNEIVIDLRCYESYNIDHSIRLCRIKFSSLAACLIHPTPHPYTRPFSIKLQLIACSHFASNQRLFCSAARATNSKVHERIKNLC